jgi:hypothetical protein
MALAVAVVVVLGVGVVALVLRGIWTSAHHESGSLSDVVSESPADGEDAPTSDADRKTRVVMRGWDSDTFI